jgi:hypothetical protein
MSKTWGRDGDLPWPSGLNPKDRNPQWPPLGYEERQMHVGCVRVLVLHVTREVGGSPQKKDGWRWYVFFAPPGENNYDTPHSDRRIYQDPVKAQTIALRWARNALITTFAKLKKGTWKELVDKPDTNLHVWRAVKQ